MMVSCWAMLGDVGNGNAHGNGSGRGDKMLTMTAMAMMMMMMTMTMITTMMMVMMTMMMIMMMKTMMVMIMMMIMLLLQVPFLLLGLDLPATPLFQDNMERNAIPQVQLNVIMQKFDGTTVDDNVKTGRRRFSVLRLPPYLILHMKRFYKNNFFIEKNPTIVNFPVKNWEVKEAIPVPPRKPDGPPPPSKYNLVANVCHDGKAGEGVYRCHVNRAAEDMWYENQDLSVVEVLPQMVALSEAFLQVMADHASMAAA